MFSYISTLPVLKMSMRAVRAKSLQSCPALCDSCTAVHQAPLSMEFPRQEYWSGLPFATPGDLPDPGLEPMSLMSPALAGRFFTTASPGKPLLLSYSRFSSFL